MKKEELSNCDRMALILSYHHRMALLNSKDSLQFAQRTIDSVNRFIEKQGEKK